MNEPVSDSQGAAPPYQRYYKQRNKTWRRQTQGQSRACKHWGGGRPLALPTKWPQPLWNLQPPHLQHPMLPPHTHCCSAMQPCNCLLEPREQVPRQARHMQGTHKLQEMKAGGGGSPSSPITPTLLQPARPSCEEESEPGSPRQECSRDTWVVEVIHRARSGWVGTVERAACGGDTGPILVKSRQGLEGQRGQHVTACVPCVPVHWGCSPLAIVFNPSTHPGDHLESHLLQM